MCDALCEFQCFQLHNKTVLSTKNSDKRLCRRDLENEKQGAWAGRWWNKKMQMRTVVKLMERVQNDAMHVCTSLLCKMQKEV